MKKYLVLFLICSIVNASEFTFESNESVNLGLSNCAIDSTNQYVLTGRIETTTTTLSNSSVKIYLGDFLLEQKEVSSSTEQSILKLLELPQEQIQTLELSIDVKISLGAIIIAKDIKIIALEDSNLSQSELNVLGLLNKKANSNQSFAFVNGVNIFDTKNSSIDTDLIGNDILDSKNIPNIFRQAVFYVDADYGSDFLSGVKFYFDGYDGPKKTLANTLSESYLMPEGVVCEIVLQESVNEYFAGFLSPRSGESLIIRSEGTNVIRGTLLNGITASILEQDRNSNIEEFSELEREQVRGFELEQLKKYGSENSNEVVFNKTRISIEDASYDIERNQAKEFELTHLKRYESENEVILNTEDFSILDKSYNIERVQVRELELARLKKYELEKVNESNFEKNNLK